MSWTEKNQFILAIITDLQFTQSYVSFAKVRPNLFERCRFESNQFIFLRSTLNADLLYHLIIVGTSLHRVFLEVINP